MPVKTANKGVRALAKEAGCSPAIVTRKLKQGKSREQIITEAASYREKKASRPAVNKPARIVNKLKPSEDFATAQRRKESALADLRELELSQKRGELVSSAEVQIAWAGIIGAAKSRLWNIADELGDRLASESSPIRCREMVAEKIRHTLTELSKS